MKKYFKIILVISIMFLFTGVAKAEVRLDVLKTMYFKTQQGGTVISPGTIRMQETIENSGTIGQGDQIFITLPEGVTFENQPNSSNLKEFITIPKPDSNRIAKIDLISSSKKSFIIEITDINQNGSRAILEFTFNNAHSRLVATKEGPIIIDFFSTTIPFRSYEIAELPQLIIEIPSFTGQPHQIVEIPLTVKSNSTLKEGEFKVVYDPSIIKLEDFSPGDFPGQVKLQNDILTFSASQAQKGNYELGKLVFRVVGDDKQQSTMDISRAEIFNDRMEKYFVKVAEGLIKVKEEKKEMKTIILKIGDNRAQVNDEEFTLLSPPILLDNKTMVPIRFISEGLGGVVNWDQGTKTIDIKINGKELSLKGDDDAQQLKIIKEVAYVPLRYVSEFFGAEINWHPISQAINIRL